MTTMTDLITNVSHLSIHDRETPLDVAATRTGRIANVTSARTRKLRRGVPPAWSMYSAMHQDVLSELRRDDLFFDFRNVDDEDGLEKSHDTNIMGQFTCKNSKCSADGWHSMRVAITIRMYTGNRYNAKVWHQRCKTCKHLAKPDIDEESYIDRVVYRLKKWKGVDMEIPPYSGGPSNGPHLSDLCEGCKNGHCNEGQA